MKELISAKTVQEAHAEGKKEITYDFNSSIVTPEAITVAKELDIKLLDKGEEENNKLRDIIKQEVIKQNPQSSNKDFQLNEIVDKVLAAYKKKTA